MTQTTESLAPERVGHNIEINFREEISILRDIHIYTKMKFSNIINLTSVLAMVLGNSNSEQSEGPIILGNYLPMTSQKNQPKVPTKKKQNLHLQPYLFYL